LAPVDREYNGRPSSTSACALYLLVGEPDRTLDQLEPLLRLPYYLSPGWLKIDPTFAAIRSNPRFERLLPADDLHFALRHL
jgi:hypothetical protein